MVQNLSSLPKKTFRRNRKFKNRLSLQTFSNTKLFITWTVWSWAHTVVVETSDSIQFFLQFSLCIGPLDCIKVLLGVKIWKVFAIFFLYFVCKKTETQNPAFWSNQLYRKIVQLYCQLNSAPFYFTVLATYSVRTKNWLEVQFC